MSDTVKGIELGDTLEEIESRRQVREAGEMRIRSRSETVRLCVRAGLPALQYVDEHEEYPNPAEMNSAEWRSLVRSAFQALEREEERRDG